MGTGQGKICCLGIFSPVIACLNLSTQHAACQCVCVCVGDSMETVEAGHTLKGSRQQYGATAAKLLSSGESGQGPAQDDVVRPPSH